MQTLYFLGFWKPIISDSGLAEFNLIGNNSQGNKHKLQRTVVSLRKHSHIQTNVSLWSLFKNTTWTMSNQSFYFQSGILAANLWPIISLMNSFQMSTFLWMLKVLGAHKKGSFVLKIPLLWTLNLCTKSVKTPSCNEIFYGSFAFVTYLDTNWGYTCFYT